jgi:transposase
MHLIVIFSDYLTMDTPVVVRRLIVLKYEEGHTQKRISQELHVPTSTVFDIIKRYRLTGDTATHQDRCRGHRVISTRDDRLLKRASDANPQATARQLQAIVGGKTAQVSICSIKRSLHLSGRNA